MNTLLVDSGSLDDVCSLDLGFDERDVHDSVRSWLRLRLQHWVGTGESPWQFAGNLRKNAADEPLPRLSQDIYQRVLREGEKEGEEERER